MHRARGRGRPACRRATVLRYSDLIKRANALLPLLVLVTAGLSHGAESDFLGPRGERLGIWSLGGSGLACELRTDAGVYPADTRLADGVHRGPLEVRGDGEEALVVGELLLRIVAGEPGEAVVIVAPKAAGAVAPDPSGTYRPLDRVRQMDLARQGHREADAALNAVYRRVMDRLPEEKRADLRQRQRRWIESRDVFAGHQAALFDEVEGDPADSVLYWESLAALTEARTAFLETYARGNPEGRIDGVWVDEAGGRMDLRLATGTAGETGLRFDISVVRGPTSHLGEIRGFAPFVDRDSRRAVFVDSDAEAAIGGRAARIELLFDGERIEVRAENTGYYHGVRAYFDGTYFRQGPLDPD